MGRHGRVGQGSRKLRGHRTSEDKQTRLATPITKKFMQSAHTPPKCRRRAIACSVGHSPLGYGYSCRCEASKYQHFAQYAELSFAKTNRYHRRIETRRRGRGQRPPTTGALNKLTELSTLRPRPRGTGHTNDGEIPSPPSPWAGGTGAAVIGSSISSTNASVGVSLEVFGRYRPPPSRARRPSCLVAPPGPEDKRQCFSGQDLLQNHLGSAGVWWSLLCFVSPLRGNEEDGKIKEAEVRKYPAVEHERR